MVLLSVAICALIAGVSVGLTAFAVAVALLTKDISEKSERVVRHELAAERSLRILAETERDGLKKAVDMQAEAIEKGALPWFPKSERLEARYENEALDRMENPSFYADVVEGLGGTK